MKRKQPARLLTLYKIRRRIGNDPVIEFEDALEQDALQRSGLSVHDLTGPDFDAMLFLYSPNPREPTWIGFLREGFANLPRLHSSSLGALLFVRIRYRNRDELFAFTFGLGRFLLRADGYERNYGLRIALNTLYAADDPTAVTAPVRVRRVDAKTVAANTLLSRRQSNRLASFDDFGLDVQRDMLGAITGVPADRARWGARIGGKDALYLNLPLAFSELGELCKDSLRTHAKRDYKIRFSWVDNVQIVEDPVKIADLEARVVASLKSGKGDKAVLAPPDLIDWDEMDSFRFSVDPDVPHQELELADYHAALKDAGELDGLDIKKLRTSHRIEAVDAEGEVVDRWPVFKCLDLEIRVGRSVFLLVGGDFFEVAAFYLDQLDDYIGRLQEWNVALPRSGSAEREGPYNERAAKSSQDYLMLDRQTVRVDSSTSPIEICDILTSNGCFVHIKRKLDSSALSHLFAQGAVSGDLLLMSRQFREKTLETIARAAGVKGVSLSSFSTFDIDGITPSRHEIVYGIIERWKGRSLVKALPFFSKVNLRRHGEDLRRMGYRVSYRRIDVA